MDKIYCDSYCQHGGCCLLSKEHEGLHNSAFCEWSDEESIPKEEADLITMAMSPFSDELTKLIIDNT